MQVFEALGNPKGIVLITIVILVTFPPKFLESNFGNVGKDRNSMSL